MDLQSTAPAPVYAVAGESIRFQPGQAVHVVRGTAPGHIRTPWYLRGKAGVVERVCGHFGNPEELAYNRPGGAVTLYRVRFSMLEIWGEDAETPTDTIDVEIFEHWLEEA